MISMNVKDNFSKKTFISGSRNQVDNSPVSVSACSRTAIHFLTGSARCDLDSDVVSLGVLEKPAKDWSEALAIVVSEVVIVWGRVWTQPEQYYWYFV